MVCGGSGRWQWGGDGDDDGGAEVEGVEGVGGGKKFLGGNCVAFLQVLRRLDRALSANTLAFCGLVGSGMMHSRVSK